MKERLFTPGPTETPERILQAMHVGNMHHRTAPFREIFGAARNALANALECSESPIFLACSGTGAMEAALRNTCTPNDKILYINAGKFGERWGDIGKALALDTVEITIPWGQVCEAEQLSEVLRKHSNVAAVCVQWTETSTGVMHDIESLSRVCNEYAPQALFIVDGISAFLTAPLSMRNCPVDILVGGSQKAPMLPPGLAFLSLSARAWDRISKTSCSSLYFDLKGERTHQDSHSTAWTPALHIILGFAESMKIFEEEGLQNTYDRHDRLSRLARHSLKQAGFEIIGEPHCAKGVTAAFPPEGVSAEDLRAKLITDFGFRIAGGQGEYKGKIIRVGHMGMMTEAELGDCLSAIAQIVG